MRLPNASVAHVGRSKILEYLLIEEHPEGGSKAHFFRQFGFRKGRWKQFAEALRNHALEHEVRPQTESDYRTWNLIEGALHPPDGRHPLVRTVWITGDDATAPRLVTAYPIESNSMTQ